jgi:hypothetical protein
VEGLVGELLGQRLVVTNKDVVDYVGSAEAQRCGSVRARLHRMSSVMVQSSIPIPASLVKSDGVLSSKKAGLET